MSKIGGAKNNLESASTPPSNRRPKRRQTPELGDAIDRLDLPRERLFGLGAQALCSAELLAVCFGAGVTGESAKTLAARLLSEFGGLDGLLGAPPQRLQATRGLGPAKTALLKALHELRTRQDEASLRRSQGFSDAATVCRFAQKRIGHREREVFGCLFLDARHVLLRWEELFLGSVNRAHVHSREVLKRAIETNASAVVLAHNHPSGNAEPSSSDIRLTRELEDLLARIDVVVLDHIIVTRCATMSMASRGLLHVADPAR